MTNKKTEYKNSVIQKQHQHAFTLIELLVIISIVGLIAAILLPAIQSAREAARKTSCSNHLKQIGLSLSNYVSNYQVFPRGFNGRGYSLHAMLLPHLELASLFNSINFQIQASAASNSVEENRTANLTQISIFLCPSIRTVAGSTYATTSYAGNGGYGVQKYGFNGLFTKTGIKKVTVSSFGYESILDGTSQTISLSEWVNERKPNSLKDPLVSTFNVTGLSLPAQFELFAAKCHDLNPMTMAGLGAKKCQWIRGHYGNSLLNFSLSPNDHNCVNNGNLDRGAFSAGSRHSHGVNSVFIDGHVRFVADSVDLSVWRTLSTRGGAEVVSQTSY